MRTKDIKIGKRYVALVKRAHGRSSEYTVTVVAKRSREDAKLFGSRTLTICIQQALRMGCQWISPANVLATAEAVEELERQRKADEKQREAERAQRIEAARERAVKLRERLGAVLPQDINPWRVENYYDSVHVRINADDVGKLLGIIESARESYDLCMSDTLPLPELAKGVVAGAFIGVFPDTSKEAEVTTTPEE